MMKRNWHQQCCELLEVSGNKSNKQDSTNSLDIFNLAVPASHCPHCGHNIRFWENIPIISYLLLKGKCSSCSQHISLRYPLVEFVTGSLCLVVFLILGANVQMLLALVLTWALIVLTLIDYDEQLLPDDITLPLLWLGLLVNYFSVFTTLNNAVLGAAAGYLTLWSVYWAFKLLTGKEGMGYGDFKLLAAFGAWFGWQALPFIILCSSLVGAIVGITLIATQKQDSQTAIPFGPYLAAAGFIYMLWGESIVRWYFSFYH